MKQILRAGIVPANSNLPRWEEVYPNLIRPDLVKITDTFTDHSGVLSGRAVENNLIVPGGTWSAAAAVAVADGCAKMTAVTGPLGAVGITSMGTGVKGQIMVRVKWGETGGYVGMVFRMTSSNGAHWRALLGNTGIQLQERDAVGGGIRSRTAPFTPVIGQFYDLKVTFDEGLIVLTCNGLSVEYTDGVSNQEKVSAGLFFYNTANAALHEVHDIYIGL
ncbi:hypothetical protein [Pseudomonas sp. PGPR40]|uniref:hypothetical protein n=1 Tax=Pseudomonas sp. PGPR40 TaxID=2913476 RepID=UPI001EDB020A|nr:hypothetical protein [Pseudomonas sp. PGPR40]